MNLKGQVSFETLLITLLIIVITIAVAHNWIDIKDDTVAIMVTKTVGAEKLSKANDFYVLKRIELLPTASASEIDLNLHVQPMSFNAREVILLPEFTEIKTKVADKTSYSTVRVRINGQEV